MEKLKPNTAYWFWNRDGRGYVEGTELHEGAPPDRNYCSMLRTDAAGEIVTFKPHGDVHSFKS